MTQRGPYSASPDTNLQHPFRIEGKTKQSLAVELRLGHLPDTMVKCATFKDLVTITMNATPLHPQTYTEPPPTCMI